MNIWILILIAVVIIVSITIAIWYKFIRKPKGGHPGDGLDLLDRTATDLDFRSTPLSALYLSQGAPISYPPQRLRQTDSWTRTPRQPMAVMRGSPTDTALPPSGSFGPMMAMPPSPSDIAINAPFPIRTVLPPSVPTPASGVHQWSAPAPPKAKGSKPAVVHGAPKASKSGVGPKVFMTQGGPGWMDDFPVVYDPSISSNNILLTFTPFSNSIRHGQTPPDCPGGWDSHIFKFITDDLSQDLTYLQEHNIPGVDPQWSNANITGTKPYWIIQVQFKNLGMKPPQEMKEKGEQNVPTYSKVVYYPYIAKEITFRLFNESDAWVGKMRNGDLHLTAHSPFFMNQHPYTNQNLSYPHCMSGKLHITGSTVKNYQDERLIGVTNHPEGINQMTENQYYANWNCVDQIPDSECRPDCFHFNKNFIINSTQKARDNLESDTAAINAQSMGVDNIYITRDFIQTRTKLLLKMIGALLINEQILNMLVDMGNTALCNPSGNDAWNMGDFLNLKEFILGANDTLRNSIPFVHLSPQSDLNISGSSKSENRDRKCFTRECISRDKLVNDFMRGKKTTFIPINTWAAEIYVDRELENISKYGHLSQFNVDFKIVDGVPKTDDKKYKDPLESLRAKYPELYVTEPEFTQMYDSGSLDPRFHPPGKKGKQAFNDWYTEVWGVIYTTLEDAVHAAHSGSLNCDTFQPIKRSDT